MVIFKLCLVLYSMVVMCVWEVKVSSGRVLYSMLNTYASLYSIGKGEQRPSVILHVEHIRLSIYSEADNLLEFILLPAKTNDSLDAVAYYLLFRLQFILR